MGTALSKGFAALVFSAAFLFLGAGAAAAAGPCAPPGFPGFVTGGHAPGAYYADRVGCFRELRHDRRHIRADRRELRRDRREFRRELRHDRRELRRDRREFRRDWRQCRRDAWQRTNRY